MEVELAWLTPDSPDAANDAAGKKAPPPIPGARVHAPPMPVKPSVQAMPAAAKELLKPTRPMGKPIPREEEDHEPPPRKRPPPLPPRRKP